MTVEWNLDKDRLIGVDTRNGQKPADFLTPPEMVEIVERRLHEHNVKLLLLWMSTGGKVTSVPAASVERFADAAAGIMRIYFEQIGEPLPLRCASADLREAVCAQPGIEREWVQDVPHRSPINIVVWSTACLRNRGPAPTPASDRGHRIMYGVYKSAVKAHAPFVLQYLASPDQTVQAHTVLKAEEMFALVLTRESLSAAMQHYADLLRQRLDSTTVLFNTHAANTGADEEEVGRALRAIGVPMIQ